MRPRQAIEEEVKVRTGPIGLAPATAAAIQIEVLLDIRDLLESLTGYEENKVHAAHHQSNQGMSEAHTAASRIVEAIQGIRR